MRRWLLTGLALAAPLLQAEPLRTVQDLRYGLVLYEYYQDEYFRALSELMVADAKGGIKGHADNPELVAGGIALSFGMDRQAKASFEALLTEEKPISVRNAAWYYLAKLQHQRGDSDRAANTLDNVVEPVEKGLVQGYSELRNQLLIRQNRLPDAEVLANPILKKSSKNSSLQAYLAYNLGAAYARAGDYEKAQQYFDLMGKTNFSKNPVLRREQLALYDKSFTAAGYSHLLQKNFPKAVEAFSRVRLDSFYANEALLGLGWAHYEQEQYGEALVPWRLATQRSLIFPSTQEALLAIGDTFEKQELFGKALRQYQLAEQIFTDELDKLKTLNQSLQEQSILTQLAAGGQPPASWLVNDETRAAKPLISYLQTLFTQNEFQALVQTLRDIYQVKDKLEEWRDKLDIYDELLVERRQRRADQAEIIATAGHSERLLALRERWQVATAELERAKSEQDIWAFLEEPLYGYKNRLDNMASTLEQLEAAGENVDAERELYERYRGIIMWQASEDFPARVWAIEDQLKPVANALAEAETRRDSVAVLIEVPFDILPHQEAIAKARISLDQRLANADALIEQLDARLRSQITAELNRQSIRLTYYLGETKLAIARLYDQSMLEAQP